MAVPTLLVTGAGGMLGANLILEALASGYGVVAVDHLHPVRHSGVVSAAVDLSRPGIALEIFQQYGPDWVIHCAADTNVDGCEADPDTAFRLNRDMAGQVAQAAQAVGAQLAHISTDAVFDGERGGYSENDEPHPINVYGQSKLEGERVVLAEHAKALVVRTNIYGWNAQRKHSLAEWFLSRLEAQTPCPGFTDVFVTPILVTDLGRVLFRALSKGVSGVHHAAGGERISKYEFGRRVALVFDLNPSLITPASVQEVALRARRGADLSLRSTKIAGVLGTRLPDVDEGLQRLREQREAGHVRALRRLMSRERS